MPPTLQELVEIAIENQPYILEQDMKDGGPLCYNDQNGTFVIRYPDGTVERHASPCPPNPQHCTPDRGHCRA